jgi:hypothetical protein
MPTSSFILIVHHCLCSRSSYLPGLVVLARSLIDAGSGGLPLVVIIPTNRPRVQDAVAGLIARLPNIKIVTKPPLPFPSSSFLRRFGSDVWLKLYCWTLTSYERVLYLDADEMVLSSLEHLFLAVDLAPGAIAQVAGQGYEYEDGALSSGILLCC